MIRRLEALGAENFDVLVVGGGIIGACTAREAALRGLRTALVEEEDFGSGTSANTLRIVHGGLRYLPHLELGAMRAAIRERSAWLRIAPHLVSPLPVLVPIRGAGRARTGMWRGALAVNDLIARNRNRGLAAERRLPVGRILNREQCVELAPPLEATGCTGGALFHDAQVYSPERLVLEVVKSAAAEGAVVANHVSCDGWAGATAEGHEIELRDHLTGQRLRTRARLVVNATGPAAAAVGQRLGASDSAGVRLSLALNLVLPDLGCRGAFAIEANGPADDAFRDGGSRRLFVVPWRGCTLVGTGHYRIEGSARSTDLGEQHAARFLEEVNRAWPLPGFRPDDVLAVHWGLLPEAGRAQRGGVKLLRRHMLVDHSREGLPWLLSVVSVKFTTARLVAEEVVKVLLRKLGLPATPSCTAHMPLPGGRIEPAALTRRAHADYGHLLPPDVLDNLLLTYGADFERVITHRGRFARWDERVAPDRPVIRAQLIHAAREEMGCTAEDLVRRSTDLESEGRVAASARRAAQEVLLSEGDAVVA